MTELGALGLRHRLAHDLAQRIAERPLHGKGNHRDRQHDENGFRRALPDEGQRCAKRLHRIACPAGSIFGHDEEDPGSMLGPLIRARLRSRRVGRRRLW